MKNHSKEEQEQVKVVRDTGSQGRSTDTSQEGWLDTEMPPGHQQVSSGHSYNISYQYTWDVKTGPFLCTLSY